MLSLFDRKAAICFCWGLFLTIPAAVFSQTNYYATNGTEYLIVGSLPGDHVFPDAAVTTNGGFIVWQDNATDGSGWGISATHLDSTLSADPNWSDHKVNVTGTNDQENARVALLKNGGAVFVWQSGLEGYQHIYARLLNSSYTFLTTTDVVVSTFTNKIGFQVNPAVATLNNSNVVVVWGSFDQAGSNSMQDVYGQIFSQTGQKIGTNFLINQFTSYNQRTPAIAALPNGGFVAVWVSEQERAVAPNLGANTTYTTASATLTPSVDIYARLYNSNGVAQGNEFLVNSDFNPCANPAVAAAADGSFMLTWDVRNMASPNNSLDIYARSFTNGVGGAVVLVNSYLYGDQYAPRISAIAGDYFIVWTSLGQDGSREGVFGQFVHEDGSLTGGELRVNTTTVGSQMQPMVTSDGVNQFLTVWTGVNVTNFNFDLYAQRYANVASVLQPMAAPFVWAPFTLSGGVYQPQLMVSWPTLLGLSVSNFTVYVDGVATTNVTTNVWTMTAANGLTAGSTHSFQLVYATTDGRHSPISPAANGKTWSGNNWGGIPFEWMTNYFGSNTNLWPSATADSDGSGLSNLEDFQTGSNPTNAATALRVQLGQTAQGMFLTWPTQPGLTYQVQVKTNLVAAWSNLGSPRFAAGDSDSIFVGGTSAAYYRVVCLYQ